MDVAIVTSLYRSRPFLGQYARHLLRVGREIRQAGLTLDVVIVANDALPAEKQAIDNLIRAAGADFQVRTLFVGREPLYASWNRAIQSTPARAIAIWNVDDVRTAGAIVEGHRRIAAGCQWIDFACTLVLAQRLAGRSLVYRRIPFKPFHYDVEGNHPLDRARPGPFFMFERGLYDQIGAFDPRYNVAGDFDWAVRASRVATACASPVDAGEYVVYGDNLSAGDLLPVEENVVLLRYGDNAGAGLRVASPDLMREAWSKWGAVELPPEIEDRLWGRAAQAAYRRRQVVNRLLPLNLRIILTTLIDRYRLRPLLSHLGLAKAKSTVSLYPPDADRP